jgi:hypothetical protein
MDKRRNHSAPDDASPTGRRKARRRDIVKRSGDDAGLETYEQSPERPSVSGRDAPEPPDGPVPPVTRPISPD